MTTSKTSPMPLSARAQTFIDSVLKLHPQLAVFDCDGTLWRDDSGEGFLYWEIERGLLPDEVVRWVKPRYEEYRAGRVSEEAMCGEMVAIHKGLPEALLERAAIDFFGQRIASGIFPEMQQLVRRLAELGCDIWAISSTSDWVIRAGTSQFGIPSDHVIAVAVTVVDGRATDQLLRVPTDETKATAVHELLPRLPDVAFGNSMHDLAMLELAPHPFAINPNPNLEQIARQRGWTVYHPETHPLPASAS
jgi:phosphoserine phosphatase